MVNYLILADELMKSSFKKKSPFSTPEDISRGEVGIMIFLTTERNNVLAGDLAQELSLSSGRIAIALKSLESKGFIARRIDENDKRKVIVSVTENGKKFAEKGRLRYLEDTQKLLRFLGEDDAKSFVRIIKKIAGIPD